MRGIISLFSFYGRARRTSYGIFFAITVVAYFVLSVPFSLWMIQRDPDKLMAQMRAIEQQNPAGIQSIKMMMDIPHAYVTAGFVASAVVVAILYIVWVLLCVRRLHDMNATGWLALIPIIVALVPFLGYLLVSAVLGLWPGSKGPNGYGPDPRQPDVVPEVFGPGGLLPRRSI